MRRLMWGPLMGVFLWVSCGQQDPSFEENIKKLPPQEDGLDRSSADASAGEGLPPQPVGPGKGQSESDTGMTAPGTNESAGGRESERGGNAGEGEGEGAAAGQTGTDEDDMITRNHGRILEFTAGRLVDARVSLTPTTTEQEFTATLVRQMPEHSETFQQESRVPGTVRFDQGHPALSLTETFSTNLRYGAIDILLVVDNSGSMRQEQTRLAPELAALLSHISHASWQVGVITTDAGSDQCVRQVIRKGDADPDGAFRQAVSTAGTGGSGYEQGLLQAARGLAPGRFSGISCTDWLQEGSTVVALIVSDEDNCSSGCADVPSGAPPLFRDTISTIRPADKARVYGIIDIPTAGGDKSCRDSYRTGAQYQTAIEATGGSVGSICAASYGPILQQISQNIGTIVDRNFVLKEIPVADTLVVKIDGVESTDYTLTGKTVDLTGDLPANAEVTMAYTSRPDTMKRSFDLGRDDISNHVIRVEVNGVETDPATREINGRMLTFQSAPPESATIEVFYYLNEPALKTSFQLANAPAAGMAVTVMAGDAVMGNGTWLIDGEILTFVSPPPDGVRITVRYSIPAGPVTEYLLLKDSTGHTLHSITDAATGEPLAGATFTGGTLRILADHYDDGRRVRVTTTTPTGDLQAILAGSPVRGSLKVGETDCSGQAGIAVDGLVLTLQCDGGAGSGEVTYRYETGRTLEFDLNRAPVESATLSVEVNNVPTREYVVEGTRLTLTGYVPPAASVRFIENQRSGPAP